MRRDTILTACWSFYTSYFVLCVRYMFTGLYKIIFCHYPWIFSLRWPARNKKSNLKRRAPCLGVELFVLNYSQIRICLAQILTELCWNVNLFKVKIIILFSAFRYMRLCEQIELEIVEHLNIDSETFSWSAQSPNNWKYWYSWVACTMCLFWNKIIWISTHMTSPFANSTTCHNAYFASIKRKQWEQTKNIIYIREGFENTIIY